MGSGKLEIRKIEKLTAHWGDRPRRSQKSQEVEVGAAGMGELWRWGLAG